MWVMEVLEVKIWVSEAKFWVPEASISVSKAGILVQNLGQDEGPGSQNLGVNA